MFAIGYYIIWYQQTTDRSVEKEPACMIIKPERSFGALEDGSSHEEESEYWREQINSKIVIQICHNDFHPKSIPKVP